MRLPSRVCVFCLGALAAPLLQGARIVAVAGGSEDGVNIPATRARLQEPFGVGFDTSGNMFIIELAGNRLLKVDAKGMLAHVAGRSTPDDAEDKGPLLAVQFRGPHNLAMLPDGDIVIADTWNGVVRRVDLAADRVTNVPGFGVPAEQARKAGPYCVTLDFTGTLLYIADLRRIHEIDLKTGRSRVVAGNGEKGIPPDGARAVEAPLVDPRAVAPDRKGNVYIVERGGHALRVVDREGRIRTVINASGKRGSRGDGGDALSAQLSGPKHLCIDRDDNVIIADAENHLIRKYLPASGKIVRVAGTGKKGAAGLGGPPEQCELARPHGVTVHRDGTLYIADSYNHRILKIVP